MIYFSDVTEDLSRLHSIEFRDRRRVSIFPENDKHLAGGRGQIPDEK